MPKITVILDDELNKRLREFIYASTLPPKSQYGKLKEIIGLALKEFLEKRGY